MILGLRRKQIYIHKYTKKHWKASAKYTTIIDGIASIPMTKIIPTSPFSMLLSTCCVHLKASVFSTTNVTDWCAICLESRFHFALKLTSLTWILWSVSSPHHTNTDSKQSRQSSQTCSNPTQNEAPTPTVAVIRIYFTRIDGHCDEATNS